MAQFGDGSQHRPDSFLTSPTAANDYLRGICPAHRYLLIAEVHALPKRLSRLYGG